MLLSSCDLRSRKAAEAATGRGLFHQQPLCKMRLRKGSARNWRKRSVRLTSLAKVIRSKNAGPCLLTLDLMLTDNAAFAYVTERIGTLRRMVAERYRRSENEVSVLPFAPALAVKITLPRDVISGYVGDRDIYGAH